MFPWSSEWMDRREKNTLLSVHQILLPDKEKKSTILSMSVSPVTSVAPVLHRAAKEPDNLQHKPADRRREVTTLP